MNLQPGYRFYPTEEELISFYLRNKLGKTRDDLDLVIRVVDVYNLDPWQLTENTGELCRGESEQWFFFCPKQKREADGGRPNRITPSGYWKATGSPGFVFSSLNQVIGVKRTMVFYQGKAPSGSKTKWKMNEYRVIQGEATTSITAPKLRDEFSLCRVYVNSGCLRAFDRRPLAEGTTEIIYTSKQKAVSNIDFSDKKKMRSSGSSNHETPSIEEKTASLDRSSSLDHVHHSHPEEIIDSEMNEYHAAILEWFNWV